MPVVVVATTPIIANICMILHEVAIVKIVGVVNDVVVVHIGATVKIV